MGCTFDIFKVKVSKEEHARKFAELWNKVLVDGDYLYDYDMDNLFDEFIEDNGSFILNIEEEPLFAFYDNGAQIHRIIMSFVENVPDSELEAEYTCTFNNCGDALFNIYNYREGKLKIRCAYSEYGEGDYCPECDEELETRLIEVDPESYANGYICPHCGEEIGYEADIKEYVLELVDGKWNYPDGFGFRLKIEAEDENKLKEIAETSSVPAYILDKIHAKKTGMAKIMISQKTLQTLMETDLQPEKVKRLKMTIDYIDLPIKVVVFPEEAPGDILFKIYLRQIWEADDMDEDGKITWNPSSGSFESAIANNDTADQLKNIVVATYYFLLLYLATTNDFKEYDTTDLYLENLLVYADKGRISSHIVYGKDRPDLLANGLMGGVEYVRPCAQEEERIASAQTGIIEDDDIIEEKEIEELTVATEEPIAIEIISKQLAEAKIGDIISIGQWYINDDSSVKETVKFTIEWFGRDRGIEYFKKVKGESFKQSFDEWMADEHKKISNMNWRVVDIRDEKVLLLIEGIIGTKAFNTQINSRVTWEKSQLRQWLATEFYEKAFSDAEKERILNSKIINDTEVPRKWKDYDFTEDKVFILSRNEIEQYFSDEEDRKIYIDASVYPSIEGYWVRTPGKRGEDVTIVSKDGTFNDSDWGKCQCNSENCGVRIAMWVSRK